jgi:cytidylate kinase
MDNFVITIARGYGSGGRQIGKKLAEELGIRMIDRELLQMASSESGISEELFALADEKMIKKAHLFGDNIKKYTGNILKPEDEEFISNENLFNYQARVLVFMASKESFIAIGRAADYVLRDFPNVLSVNIQAPFEDCVRSITRRFMMEDREAEKSVKNIDKYRAGYYKYYTGRDWKDPANYDICLSSSRLGRDKCVDVIKACARVKFSHITIG